VCVGVLHVFPHVCSPVHNLRDGHQLKCAFIGSHPKKSWGFPQGINVIIIIIIIITHYTAIASHMRVTCKSHACHAPKRHTNGGKTTFP